jgi:hypothetical protein
MKTRFLIPVLAAFSPLLQAESPAGTAPERPSSTQPDDGKPKGRDKMMSHLPPELRERFEAAREKAMQDPAIQELRKKADTAAEDFRKAMREAMMKADPGLADVLKDRMGGKPPGGKDGKRDGGPGFANLSEGDRQKLMAAREKAKTDPAVQAAEAKKQAAKSPEERRAAGEEFHKAMKEALLKADPSLGPIIDQLKPPQGPPKPPMGPAMPPGGE